MGADGAQSLVRKSLGTVEESMVSWQYHQMGLVATLKISPSDEPNLTAWQRFLPSGPIALLPLGPSSSSLVWTVPKAELQALLNMKEEVMLLLTSTRLIFTFCSEFCRCREPWSDKPVRRARACPSTYQGGASYAWWDRGKAFTSNSHKCFSARCFSPCLWPLPLLCGAKDCPGWGQRP